MTPDKEYQSMIPLYENHPALAGLADAADAALALTVSVFRAGGRMLLCGNGGSAATASHIANDLSCHMKNWQRDAYRIVCLNDSPAVLTSMTNDYGFEHVFEKPLLGLATRETSSGASAPAETPATSSRPSRRRAHTTFSPSVLPAKGAGSCATLSTCGSRPRPKT